MLDIDSYKEKLLLKKKELQNINEISKDSRKAVKLDQTTVGRLSRMDAMQQQSMALATARNRENHIKRIDMALKRIENGDYGYCLACDEKISKKRLDFDPAVPNCINCSH